MARRKQTYYEVLGLKADAMPQDVGIAYQRKLRALRREDTPPDVKAESRLKEAHEVLADAGRRAEYDQQLLAARIKPALDRREAFIAAGFIVLVGAALYYYFRPTEPAQAGRPLQEIMESAAGSVGRLERIDMSGRSAPIGLAFAIDEGRMVTSCRGIGGDVQLVVRFPPRLVPARVATMDEAGSVCQLAVAGAGSWALSMSDAAPRMGDVVYALVLDGAGRIAPIKGAVRRVESDAKLEVIEASVSVPPASMGAPLVDRYGRVVAVAAALPDGSAHYIVPPKKWADLPAPPPPAAPEPAEPAQKSAEPKEAPPLPNSPIPISPERAERLQKAFHPPPNVPGDL